MSKHVEPKPRKKSHLVYAALGGAGLLSAVAVACGGGGGYGDESDYPVLNETSTIAPPADVGGYGKVPPPPPAVDTSIPAAGEKADVDIQGDAVDNIRPDPLKFPDFYQTDLKPGEGLEDKGGTFLSVPIGEVAKNPVRVAVTNPPFIVKGGDPFTVGVLVADNKGPLDLNAFTRDKDGKAGDTFLEHPGELQEDGRPLAHCHIGVTTVDATGFPGDTYDAAFSGVQGVKGDLTATVGGLNAGEYRADVFCSQPGHLILPTNVADRVQAFDTFRFEVK